MIMLYTGAVGSGKSYSALVRGINRIRSGKYVIANFPITYNGRGSERWIYNDDITVDFLVMKSFEMGWFGREGSCLIIIDEAGIIFNSRDAMLKYEERKKWIKFLAQSRKYGYDIILVSQQDRMLDRQIRSLAEYEYKHKNMRNYWWLAWLPIRLHCQVVYWYGEKFKGLVQFFVLKRKYFKMYDTMRIFNIDEIKEMINKIYDGVPPAHVARVLSVFERKEEREEKKETQGMGG